MIWDKKNIIITFILLWILVSGGLFLGFYLTGFMPQYVSDFTEGAFVYLSNNSEAALINQFPEFSSNSVSIIIPKINLVSSVVFPTSTDLKVLDKALYSGPVHYPDSAMPGEGGNVFIFGHSTGLPVVKNKAFTVFTKLNELKEGDQIVIQSNGVNYFYAVSVLKLMDPKEGKVYFDSSKPMLTLATCWPIGIGEKRTVVEAEYVGKNLATSR